MKTIVLLILILLAVSLSLFFFIKDNKETKNEVNSGTSTPPKPTSSVTTPPKPTSSVIKYFDIRNYFNKGYSSNTPRDTPVGTRSATTPSGTRSATTPSGTRSATTPAGTRSATTPAGTRSATTPSGTLLPTNAETTPAGTFAATTPAGTLLPTTPAGTLLPTNAATTPAGTIAATNAATYPSVYTTAPTNNGNRETFVETFVVKDPSNNTFVVEEDSEIYNTDGLLYIGKHDPTDYGKLLSELDDKYEELKDRVPPKCDTPIKCMADFGTNIGEDLCCGQTGVLQDTKYICPFNKPICGNFKCGSKFGQCS